ncbi:MAG: hypothetical protein QOC78_3803 [Solirubrobacteraceae bacterium]|jgi:hypothetical protein|nr:hypothetical protein [Solirubrobacteraceae bacterium]
MGRRSRKRGPTTPAPPPPAPPAQRRHARARSTRAPMGEAPKAPWSPFPLVELAILLALVLLVAGALSAPPRRGILVGAGLALVTLAGLELALREHLHGFRSHSSLLAGATAILVDVPLYLLTGLPQLVLVLVAAAVFAAAFGLWRRAFRRRSGGLGFRA